MGANRVKNVRGSGMAVLAVLCVITLPVTIKAQGDPAKARMQEMDRRELQLSNLGRNASPANDRKRAQALMDQVGEDFERILTLHNEIVRTLATNRPLNNKFVSDAAGEIKKRSARLQSTLKLSKPEPATDDQAKTPERKGAGINSELILLCQQIESFVKNPIIEKPGTIDAQQFDKARKDLASIVELSDAIKKHVDNQKP